MGFLGDIFSGVVKVALTPVAIVKDIANIAEGETPNATKKLIKSTINDVKNAADEGLDGNIL